MTEGARRGITRGYAAMIVFGTVTVAASLTVAVWGLLALGLDTEPVSTSGRPRWVPPAAIALGLAILAGTQWRQTIALLRGRPRPAWPQMLAAAVGAYLVWCLVGLALGLGSSETWTSPFALTLVPIWLLSSLMHWALIVRRVYGDRDRPRWPWERDDDLGPDWTNYGLDPWSEAGPGFDSEGDAGRGGAEGGDRDDDGRDRGGDR